MVTKPPTIEEEDAVIESLRARIAKLQQELELHQNYRDAAARLMGLNGNSNSGRNPVVGLAEGNQDSEEKIEEVLDDSIELAYRILLRDGQMNSILLQTKMIEAGWKGSGDTLRDRDTIRVNMRRHTEKFVNRARGLWAAKPIQNSVEPEADGVNQNCGGKTNA